MELLASTFASSCISSDNCIRADDGTHCFCGVASRGAVCVSCVLLRYRRAVPTGEAEWSFDADTVRGCRALGELPREFAEKAALAVR